MEIARLVLGFIRDAAWPAVAIFGLYRYRTAITEALTSITARANIKFAVAGVTIETTLGQLELSVSENLRGRKLTDEQWRWLAQLREQGESPYPRSADSYKTLRPLRNAGLIREHPEGTLTDADSIEITTLGRLLLNAREK
jgi:hypothetical protein